jgi:hypothetical protein
MNRCARAPRKDAELINTGKKRINRFIPILFAIAILTGCPLPYQYTPEGYPGQAAGADPSTPDISASPVALYSEASGNSGTVTDGGSATTSSDTEITFASATVGAVIYYTTDGSTPDPRSASTRKYVPGSPLKLAVSGPTVDSSSASLAVRATAIGPNMKPSLITSASITVQYPQAAAPTFSIPSASYAEDQRLAIGTATEGAAIYYTMVAGNGPAPRPSPGQEGTYAYSGPVDLTGPNNIWTISAIAVKDQLIASVTSAATYGIVYTGCGEPFFTPSAGTYDNDIDLVLRGQAASTIWYTADGREPVVGSSPSGEPGTDFTLPGLFPTAKGWITMRARATAAGFNPSGITTAEYLFKAAKPTVSIPIPPLVEGTTVYCNRFDLTLSSASAASGAIVYYTTDGTDPRTSLTRMHTYGAAVVTIGKTTTLRAIAVKTGYLDSDEFIATYELMVAAPAFDRGAGDYFGTWQDTFTVTITCATAGARITCTDGNETWYNLASGAQLTFTYPRNSLQLTATAAREDFQDSVPGFARYSLWEMPSLTSISTSATLTPPSVLPEGAPAGDYWKGYKPWGWTNGTYTYVIWDPDYQNWGSFAIAAYNANWGKVAEWLIPGNRYITDLSLDNTAGTITLYGQYGPTVIHWLDILYPAIR